MKLLRTIRLDPSDTFVFERAADPGEWAVSGAFMFAHADPDALDGKSRAAFRGGFLGVASLGWSTLVQIVEASDADQAPPPELAEYNSRLLEYSRRKLVILAYSHAQFLSGDFPTYPKPEARPRRKSRSRPRSATVRATPLLQCAARSRTARSARHFARCIRAARVNRCAPFRLSRSRTKRKRTKTSICSRWRGTSKPIEMQANRDEV